MICDHGSISSHCMQCLHEEQERGRASAPETPAAVVGPSGSDWQAVAEMQAIDDGIGTAILHFYGERPPAGTVLYAKRAAGVRVPEAPILTEQDRNILAVALLRFEQGLGHANDIARAKALRAALAAGVLVDAAPSEITPEMMTEAAKRVGFEPVPGRLTRLAGVLNAMLSNGMEGCDVPQPWKDLRTAANIIVMRADQLRGKRERPPEVKILADAIEATHGVGAALPAGEAVRRPGLVCGRCGCADLMVEGASGVAPSETEHEDTARLRYVYSGTRTESKALVDLELRLLNGETPTLDEVRIAIDAARTCGVDLPDGAKR